MNHANGWRIAVGLCVVAAVARLAIAATTPLFPDETYYWDWSRQLAFGYFDHPPLIAWLIAPGVALLGVTEIGVRLFPVLAGFVGTLFIAATARRLGGDRAAVHAAAMLAVMPLSAAGLVLATPDAPLLAAVAGAMYCVTRALEHSGGDRGARRWWLYAGVALGLGVSAKYTAVLLPLGIFVGLLVSRERRRHLAEPGPYLATAIALVAFAPVIIWNARHDWASFVFQLRHGLSGVGGSIINRELELLGGQLGLVTPILFVMLAIAVARAYRQRTVVAPVLAVTASVIFVFFMYSATKRRVEANWPALAYLPAIALAAAYAGTRRWAQWMKWGVGFAAVLTLVTYVNAYTPILPVPARRDPAARAWGWDTVAAAVNRRYAPRLSISSYRTWVAADRYQDASEVAFHLPDHPRVFSLNLAGRTNQYALWPGFTDMAQPGDGLLVVGENTSGVHPAVEQLASHFETTTRGDSAVMARNGDVVKVMRVWHLERWRGTWPVDEIRSRP